MKVKVMGKVKVNIIIPNGDWDIEEEFEVRAMAELVVERLEGYSDRPATYEEYIDSVVVDEEEMDEYVKDNYGEVHYAYYIDEDTFEERDI